MIAYSEPREGEVIRDLNEASPLAGPRDQGSSKRREGAVAGKKRETEK